MCAVELGAHGLELTSLELGYAQSAPAFGSANQGGIHQLQNGTLAEGVRDDLGAPALFAEQALEEIRGADRPAPATFSPPLSSDSSD